MNVWINGLIKHIRASRFEYTRRLNLDRGYMKLEVWQRAIDLYKLIWKLTEETKLLFLLRGLETKKNGTWNDRIPNVSIERK